MMWTIRKCGLFVAVNLALTALLFIAVEAVSTGILYLADRGDSDSYSGPSHTQPDSLLGWTNVPNLSQTDFYGPGLDVRINSRGFRNAEIDPAIPPGKVRLICAGDSFTFGEGVGNDDAWPARIAALDERFEVVNMGQPGYGADQAYLWYERDGASLEHDVMIFAFITWDFYRMEGSSFEGIDKPVLRLKADSLVLTNVPIALPSAHRSVWQRFAPSELRSIRLAHKLTSRIRSRGAEPPDSRVDLEGIAAAIIADLNRTVVSRGATLMLVHLPVLEDAEEDRPKTNAWRAWISETADDLGVEYVDLVETVRLMPGADIPPLFLTEPSNPAAGHYSRHGNHVFAEAILNRVTALPTVKQKLAPVATDTR